MCLYYNRYVLDCGIFDIRCVDKNFEIEKFGFYAIYVMTQTAWKAKLTLRKIWRTEQALLWLTNYVELN